MDQEQHQHHGHTQQPVMGVIAGTGPMAYGTSPYQSGALLTSRAPSNSVPSLAEGLPALSSSPHQLSYQQAQHHQQQLHQHQHQQLQMFWANQAQEIEQATDFKNHNLPLARIKKIMKADEDVRMISAEAPVVFAKACEMFILELTLRSWIHAEENKRRTLQKNDIAAAISRTDVFDFLVDIIPRDELKEESLGVARAPIPPMAGSPAGDMPYYYAPPAVGHPGMMMGNPIADQAAAYGMQKQQNPQPHMAFLPWQQPQQPHKQGDAS